jgi:hypothetical protein
MDQAETAHNPFPQRIITQFGDYHPFFIADDNVFHTAGTIDEDGDLTPQIAGNFDKAGRQIVRTEFRDRHPPAVETFQRLDLA